MNRSMILALVAFIAVILGMYGARWFSPEAPDTVPPPQPGAVSFVEPDLTPMAAAGKQVYLANCAQCHGQRLEGSDKGPPLLHRVYHPGHHADGAFVMAVRQGVRAHHWGFGDMPAQPQIGDQEIAGILAYVRGLQQASGLF